MNTLKLYYKEHKTFSISMLVIAVICFIIGLIANNNTDVIYYFTKDLNEKAGVVAGLMGGTTSLSFLISALPSDLGTPVANQVANINTYLILILSIIYLEKYLFPIVCFGCLSIAIPISCIGILISKARESGYDAIWKKIIGFSIVLVLIVPVSSFLTNQIDRVYETNKVLSKTQESIDSIKEVEKAEVEQADKNPLVKFFEDSAENIKDFFSATSSVMKEGVDYFLNVVQDLVESAIVLLVTSCLIPLIVLYIFMKLSNIILGTNIISTKFNTIKNKIDTKTHEGVNTVVTITKKKE